MLLRTALIAALAAGAAADAAKVAMADHTGFMVRLRGVVVAPNDDSTAIALDGAPVAGSSVTVDDDPIPELDITYKWAPNWGVELILGTSNHTVTAQGTLGTLGDVIDTDVLPPTLTLQYHFNPIGKFRPYVGIGVNYTLFFNSDVEGPLNAPGADVDLDSSWGVAGQVGFDFDITDKWFVNFDFKYIDLNTTATFDGTILNPVRATVDVDIDPIVVGGGIGYRF